MSQTQFLIASLMSSMIQLKSVSLGRYTLISSGILCLTFINLLIVSLRITSKSSTVPTYSYSRYIFKQKIDRKCLLFMISFIIIYNITAGPVQYLCNYFTQLHNNIFMGLLGKTLKGRSTRPGGIPPAQNIKIRQIAKTQDEFDQLKKLADMKRGVLRSKIKEEHKFVNFNKRKLMTYWRKIMRMAKTEDLKNQIQILSQKYQRDLDTKQAFIQMLDRNLDEAQDQFQMALGNHLMHIESLTAVQDARIRGLQDQFRRNVEILEYEYAKQKTDMEKTRNSQIKELEDTIQTVREEQRRIMEETKQQEQAYREEVKNWNLQQQSSMKTTLDTKQGNHFTELQQMSQKFTADLQTRQSKHKQEYEQSENVLKRIRELQRKIASKKAKIDRQKLKTLQHKKQSAARNCALRKQKDNISKNYQQLKAKMTKFREEQQKRLVQLVNNCRNSVLKLKQIQQLGEKNLKTAQLCRRLQTQKQKVIPFYESTAEDEQQIDPNIGNQLSADQKQEFRYLNNFYKRHNKVLLDTLAIRKQKQALERDNSMFKSLLQQYFNGISVNDDVMNNMNSLMILNNKINLNNMPVQQQAKEPTYVEGNAVISATMNQLGYIPRQGI